MRRYTFAFLRLWRAGSRQAALGTMKRYPLLGPVEIVTERMQRHPFNPKRIAPVACVAILGAALARAELPQRSPFLPPAVEEPTPAAAAMLQFCGYIEASDGLQFRVNDTARKAGAWLRLNESNPALDLIVKGHDVEHDTLVVEQHGQRLTLPLHRAKILNVGMTGAAAIPSFLPAPAPTAGAGPSSGTTVNEVEKLAAAIAERRAARAQAAGPVPPPTAK
jgi:hypothetical protein